jgi:hypothetical protein
VLPLWRVVDTCCHCEKRWVSDSAHAAPGSGAPHKGLYNRPILGTPPGARGHQGTPSSLSSAQVGGEEGHHTLPGDARLLRSDGDSVLTSTLSPWSPGFPPLESLCNKPGADASSLLSPASSRLLIRPLLAPIRQSVTRPTRAALHSYYDDQPSNPLLFPTSALFMP